MAKSKSPAKGQIENTNKISDQLIAAGIGLFLLLLILGLAVFIPCPSAPTYNIFRIVISVAVAGVISIIPGTFKLKLSPIVIAGGALAVFAFVFKYDPAQLNLPSSCPDGFELTVYVHGPEGKNDRVLINKGKVTIDFGNDPRLADIGSRGEAHFMEIPLKFHGKALPISVEGGDVYKPTFPDSAYLLNGNPIYLQVSLYGLDVIKGLVTDGNGNVVDEATVRIGEIDTKTKNGYFKLEIPAKLQRREQTVTITKPGYKVWEGTVTPETGQELKAVLEKN